MGVQNINRYRVSCDICGTSLKDDNGNILIVDTNLVHVKHWRYCTVIDDKKQEVQKLCCPQDYFCKCCICWKHTSGSRNEIITSGWKIGAVSSQDYCPECDKAYTKLQEMYRANYTR